MTKMSQTLKNVNVIHTFQFVVEVLQNNPDELYNGQNQSSKRKRACVIPGITL